MAGACVSMTESPINITFNGLARDGTPFANKMAVSR